MKTLFANECALFTWINLLIGWFSSAVCATDPLPLGSSPFYFYGCATIFGAVTLNRFGISKIVCFYAFQEVSFFVFRNNLDICFPYFCKILSFSSL